MSAFVFSLLKQIIKVHPGIVTSLAVLSEITSDDVDCCNFHEFHTADKYISWTPQGNICQISAINSSEDVGIEVLKVWDNETRKR